MVKRNKILGFIPKYNGVSYLAIIPVLFFFAILTFGLISFFTPLPKNDFFDAFNFIAQVSGGLGGIAIFIAGWAGWSETGALVFGKKILNKDLRYMGLRSVAKRAELTFFKKSFNKRVNPILRWVAYSSAGHNNIKDVTKETSFYKRGSLRTKVFADHNDFAEIVSFLKEETKVIKSLKKRKEYNAEAFKKGLPLATYLLLSNGYEDRVERAVFFKNHNDSPARVFMMNQFAETAADLESFEALPDSWLIKVTDADYSLELAKDIEKLDLEWVNNSR